MRVASDGGTKVDQFVDRFAHLWAARGGSRVEGLIAGYLLIDESDGVKPSELAHRLSVSRGSVSTYTRKLAAQGFVRRVRKPGDRSHYFVMDEDVWAGFLEAEQTYLENQRRLAAETLPHVRQGSRAWERVRNMRDYMAWQADNRLGSEWIRFKAERDACQRG
ncbi:GbsR/MarR family transcriptional regulator [Natronoglycomyces albus]|uniref:MarR family transcriptional regulator n=1 Tax=Natronoglycomyces albus TaxID=2811108 RepID=A0A895XSL8_9ACTN|nr:MarR family transcriptional regulator [Natronoglycomyces albus]QSB06319.1 MarR family transcriptional regulator [Natronoglycomyces albus]